jgi:hypothetical protein
LLFFITLLTFILLLLTDNEAAAADAACTAAGVPLRVDKSFAAADVVDEGCRVTADDKVEDEEELEDDVEDDEDDFVAEDVVLTDSGAVSNFLRA